MTTPVRFLIFPAVFLVCSACQLAPTAPALDKIRNHMVKAGTAAGAAEKIEHLLEGLRSYLELEEQLSPEGRGKLVGLVRKFAQSRERYRTYDYDIDVTVREMAGMFLAFLGEPQAEALFKDMRRNAFVFPDLRGYALLWLDKREGIDVIHERAYGTGQWLLSSAPVWRVVVDRADTRLRAMKQEDLGPERAKKCDEILTFHEEVREYFRSKQADRK